MTLTGEVANPEPLFAAADVFVLATRYEGYGMVFAEALAQGLPIVGTRAGAVPEVVPDSAGILVEIDDVAALSAALRRLIGDSDLRENFAKGAKIAARTLRSWDDAARAVSSALDAVQL